MSSQISAVNSSNSAVSINNTENTSYRLPRAFKIFQLLALLPFSSATATNFKQNPITAHNNNVLPTVSQKLTDFAPQIIKAGNNHENPLPGFSISQLTSESNSSDLTTLLSSPLSDFSDLTTLPSSPLSDFSISQLTSESNSSDLTQLPSSPLSDFSDLTQLSLGSYFSNLTPPSSPPLSGFSQEFDVQNPIIPSADILRFSDLETTDSDPETTDSDPEIDVEIHPSSIDNKPTFTNFKNIAYNKACDSIGILTTSLIASFAFNQIKNKVSLAINRFEERASESIRILVIGLVASLIISRFNNQANQSIKIFAIGLIASFTFNQIKNKVSLIYQSTQEQSQYSR